MATAKARARARWDRAAGGKPSPIRYVIDPRGIPEVIGMIADNTVGGTNRGIEMLPRKEALQQYEGAVLDWEERVTALIGQLGNLF